MAFTEATLNNQLDGGATGRTITIEAFIPGTSGVNLTSIYAVGVLAPYAGRSRWVDVPQSQNAGQAAATIQNALTT